MLLSSTAPRLWLRRAAAYVLGFIIPWSLVFQLLGTLLVGRSEPENAAAWILSAVPFFLTSLIWAATSQHGQPVAHRIAALQLVDHAGVPATRMHVLAQSLAHALDLATFGIGFLWALVDRRRQTLGDKPSRARISRCA